MEPFIGQVMMFGGNFAPRDWALCDGQLLAISTHSALFSILGTTYGGDGRTTFGLPDLRGRSPIHAGSGPGLTSRQLGQSGGEQTVTLSTTQIPSHTHLVNCRSATGNTNSPEAALPAATDLRAPVEQPYTSAATNATMNGSMIEPAGGNASHDNMQPFQVINYVIALVGLFPSRN